MGRRHWLGLMVRIVQLSLRRQSDTAELIRSSYDRIACGYDDAWTNHMRGLSLEMLDRLGPCDGLRAVDLTCGTGFVTAELARRTGGRPTGVDASAGMLDVARRKHGQACDFVQADALAYLRSLPAESVDLVTCGWGLGYTRPWRVIGQARRVLRRGGRLAVIDNSLFSLAGVLWCAMQTFAERPADLAHVMQARFLPRAGLLAGLMRARGFRVGHVVNGSKSYTVHDGREAIARLTATGAAAGFEFAARPEARDDVFARFAANLERRRTPQGDIVITHRYLSAIGQKR